MAIYLSRKKGGTVATPITPSNSSPAQMTANVAVNPTANGYAIASYDSVTPSSTPTSVSTNDIVKIGGSGVIVDSIPTPTSITPSNSNPPTLTADTPVNPSDSGYAVSTYETRYPQTIPASVTSGNVYYMRSNGYVISSYNSVNPSDVNPPELDTTKLYKPTSAGYLYASSGLGKCKAGTFTSSTSNQTITLGFQAKYLLVMSSALTTNIFDTTYSSTKAVYATSSAGATSYTISGNTSNNHISAISSTGFTFNKSGSAGTTIYYFAVG